MKKIRITLIIAFCFVLLASIMGLVACGDDDTPLSMPPVTVGRIQGAVLDLDGNPIEDVEVYYNEEDYVESNENGKFEIKQIDIADVTLTAVLKGYNDVTKQIKASQFNENGIATTQIVMEEGIGKIRGTIFKPESDEGLGGVRVYIDAGNKYSTITDADGMYEFTNVPMLENKKVNIAMDGYKDDSKNLTKRQFTNGVATVNFELAELDLDYMPGLRPRDLERNPIDPSKLSFNADEIHNYFGVSRDNLQGSSKTETHPEGFCVNADTMDERDNLVSFIYANVQIDNGHHYLTAHAMMFANQNNESNNGGRIAELGLYAVTEDGEFLNNGELGPFVKMQTSTSQVVFNLSEYHGQTLTLILGTKTGYHCCIERLEFSNKKPAVMTVNNVNGLGSIAIYDKVTDKSFDVAGMKSKWHIGGATTVVTEGIQLNGKDPWKAYDYDSANPQPVNSYVYMTTDITAQASTFKLTATIVDLNQIQDGAQNNREFYPYICVILIDKNGNKLTQTAWTKVDVKSNNQSFELEFDFSAYAREDVTVVIACNVGYRATITAAEFTGKEADKTAPDARGTDDGDDNTGSDGDDE